MIRINKIYDIYHADKLLYHNILDLLFPPYSWKKMSKKIKIIKKIKYLDIASLQGIEAIPVPKF